MGDRKGLFSFLNFESLVDNLSGYVEKRIALFKIELKEDLALAAARFVVVLILSLSGFMLILFLSLGLAVLLNNVLQSSSMGFFIVAGFYVLIFLLFILLKNKSSMEESLQETFLKIFNSLDEKNGNEGG